MNVLPSMNNRLRCALIGLRWSLAIVIFIEAALFLFGPQSRHALAATHMPAAIRVILGWGEIAGSILVLIPRLPKVHGYCWEYCYSRSPFIFCTE